MQETYLDLLLLKHESNLIDSLLDNVDSVLVDRHATSLFAVFGTENDINQLLQFIDVFLMKQ